MKRRFFHPEPSHAEKTGPRYWRSLDELSESPAFREYLEREFPEGASELSDVDRRNFLKIMAASFAFGGLTLTGCRRPEGKLLPYANSPEQVIPGLPLFFASAAPRRKGAVPIVVETQDGRPTKIEGNPSYAAGGGATDLITQATILDLYDPDRSTTHRKNGAPVDAAPVHDLLAGILGRYGATQGRGLAFLAEQSSSPTRLRLVQALRQRLPQAVWAEYEPVDQTAPDRAATRLVGRPARVHYDFRKARQVLAVDSDFMALENGALEYTRAFTDGRRVKSPDEDMNRLYAVESSMTLIGGMADHRLRLPSSQMVGFLAQLATELGVGGLGRLAGAAPAEPEWVRACAADLREHRGQSVVATGFHLPELAHAIALRINQALGAIGQTVLVAATDEPAVSSIHDVAEAIRGGGVQTLFILGGNPVYNAPADLDWASLQKSVAEVVRVGYYVDETSEGATWHLSEAHYLESWGDARAVDGTILPIQPMIVPLFGGLTQIEILARILGESAPDPYSQVYATFSARAGGGDAEAGFRKFVYDGFLADSAYPTIALGGSGLGGFEEAAPTTTAPGRDNLEIRFIPDYAIDDGRHNNNGWLQECPDPITKLTWDNAIIISPRLATDLGVMTPTSTLQIIRRNPNPFYIGKEYTPVARITLGGRTIKGAIHIQPGLDNYTVVLALGYGRSRTGRVGEGSGFNAYAIRSSDGMYIAPGATIEVLEDETFILADTQEHWSMEGRAIVREANLESYKEHPDFVEHIGMESHAPPVFGNTHLPLQERIKETPRGYSLYGHPNYTSAQQWGMSIDLTTCTGCNACVVACQAENNVPIVGRDQVRRGREMHWIRIDRYYADGRSEAKGFGGPDNAIVPEDPQIVVQPMACMHCETAPCEMVCPVNATVHDEQGLNVMAYNRCIGTRYCANNCPYKVRRFNFFDFNQRQLDSLYMGPLGPHGMPELLKMVKNPDVTVRMRGVMEKCTYCVQRIQEAKIHQKVKAQDSPDVKVPDGAVKTACQQVCPAGAIVFGDVADPESAVSKLKALSRDYSVLGYLNTRPRTTYLGRLRNPNRQMPDYYEQPLTTVEYQTKNPHPHAGEGEGGAEAAPEQAGHGNGGEL